MLGANETATCRRLLRRPTPADNGAHGCMGAAWASPVRSEIGPPVCNCRSLTSQLRPKKLCFSTCSSLEERGPSPSHRAGRLVATMCRVMSVSSCAAGLPLVPAPFPPRAPGTLTPRPAGAVDRSGCDAVDQATQGPGNVPSRHRRRPPAATTCPRCCRELRRPLVRCRRAGALPAWAWRPRSCRR